MLFPMYVPPVMFPPLVVQVKNIGDVKHFYHEQWKECEKCKPMIMKNGKFVPMTERQWYRILKKYNEKR